MNELACVGSSDLGASNTAILGEPTYFVDFGLEVVLRLGCFDEMAVLQGFTSGQVDTRIDEMVTVRVTSSAVKYGIVDGWLG